MTPALSRRTALALSLAALALPRAGWAQAREIVEMSMGAPDAPVTLVEYAMFTCPHCKAFQEEVFPQIKANFIDTGKVRLIYREVYFNRPSLWAAMIARCAPADRYFGIVDLLFERQAEWSGAFDSEPMMKELYSIGRQAGLTDEQMQACVTDRAFAEGLVAEFQKNATADGIDATPTFLINGTKVSNMNYADFEAKLNEALGN
ncbi:MAG TPA: DsbA family protein [Amaricoccus sp.]|uniref:DsbA family protein n=1 Tax=Amaricoccus sp. TaxID=1872485 RepID=UPI001DB4F653|nr:DsbA family protein [Amaricoccus sp.]MCB1371959.1 DsbA family protein [Paracoccaceae bacterium]MCB1373435.1 DsbA family protein [Paracoccaceae bacterium]MCB1401612.1 DsbA family protein [Paracoccaceae bacterium]HPG21230.1 DsbA family protein [Amaricoccus sp.]HRW13912.1 DsbA family protein [Amaricoccus sp.]